MIINMIYLGIGFKMAFIMLLCILFIILNKNQKIS